MRPLWMYMTPDVYPLVGHNFWHRVWGKLIGDRERHIQPNLEQLLYWGPPA